MTVEARFLENAGAVNNARDDRRLLSELLGLDYTTTPGIAAGGVFRYTGVQTTGDLAVTQSGTPGMSVVVTRGAAYINGSQATDQGGYFLFNDADATLTIDPSDPVSQRIDVVLAQARDTEFTPGTDDGRIFVVKGTPGAGVPSVLTYPNALVLAYVTVDALAASIADAKITDKRRDVIARGGIYRCLSTELPAAPYNGLVVYLTDTGVVQIYNATTAAYESLGQASRAWVFIDEVLRGSTGAIAFASIPQTFTHLQLVCQLRPAEAAATTALIGRFNGDSGANYDNAEIRGGTNVPSNVAGVAATSASFGAVVVGSSAAANKSSAVVVDIPNYRGGFHKSGLARACATDAASSMWIDDVMFSWRNTAAITGIELRTSGGANFLAGSIATLLGLRTPRV